MPNDPIMEREANYFAMCLLMPESFVRAEVEKMGGIDIANDKDLAKLAKVFRVSQGMMALRLEQVFRMSREF